MEADDERLNDHAEGNILPAANQQNTQPLEADERTKPSNAEDDNNNEIPTVNGQNPQSFEADERPQDDNYFNDRMLCRRISSPLLDTRPAAVNDKLNIILAMVALLIALFIGMLLGGGVPDEVIRNNTVLQAQIKQISLALEKQGDQINKLADTINRVFNTTQDTAVRVNDIYSNTDAKNTGNIKQILKTTADSANTLMKLAQSSSKIEGVGTSTGAAVKDVLAVANNLLETQSQCTVFVSLQSFSCKDIKAAYPIGSTGYYYPNGSMVYCNMGKLCGSSGGWTRLAHLNMSDETQDCPSEFQLYQFANRRVCGRPNSNGGSCVSVQFPTNGISYSQVCGRVEGHARATPDAFHDSNHEHDLNSSYVDGVSITRGSPRQHVWTFAATEATEITHGGIYICPCSPGSVQKVPSFVDKDYYCEGGAGDPLWDGRDCLPIEEACCSSPNLPWFHRQYDTPTTDYMELRVCANEDTNNEDVPISFYDIYVK